ncbi:MAG: acyl-ACP--UDP-N-acetylglucosamine O-acyltransferase [Puniceicoccales bacterium]|jgi:UDP-N-acetylglucosamine acyltransferase|nr:acyl-ACP--UDP-N-acetylglucosamine O-acyltransferase [Puniceicoccales bacterium]
MIQIHSTAIVEQGAVLASDVEIGAYAYIGGEAMIGAGTTIHHHATVEGKTALGKGNRICAYAFLGGQTQDLKYKGESAGLNIGDNNIFREYVTVHCGTREGGMTSIGNDNAFLSHAHVAHDCTVGNHVIMSSLSALAGYVKVGDYVNIAWNAGVHQFCRIGDYAMLAGSSKAVMDVLPFMLAEGQSAKTRFFNKVNLERNHFSKEEIEHVKDIYRILFRFKENRSQSLARLKENRHKAPKIYDCVINAIEQSERGFC